MFAVVLFELHELTALFDVVVVEQRCQQQQGATGPQTHLQQANMFSSADVNMHNEENSTFMYAQQNNQLQQNNMQVNQQFTAHVHVNDEQQQLLTLQVAAAAASSLAEAQLHLVAADNVVQQQQQQIAQLTHAAQTAQLQTQQVTHERMQLEQVASERVRLLEHELALAKQSSFSFQQQQPLSVSGNSPQVPSHVQPAVVHSGNFNGSGPTAPVHSGNANAPKPSLPQAATHTTN